MLRDIRPDFYVPSIYSIDFSKLKKIGIKSLIVDIDNTLMYWGAKNPDERAKELLNYLVNEGFKVCLLSNSSKRRITRFKGDIDIEYYSAFGIKPMKKMFEGALKILNSKPNETCCIGDQIYTDVLGAKRCGIITILVDPTEKKEFITTKIIRKVEGKIRNSLNYSKEIMKDE
ncbi:YqeG family HAD IIIA-type phosphatase [Caloramator sp. CAR-1]|uniref:YqeG family HAD IIIA-type phosphatase n=1 Tax=Caloramator sp. CAR-1 TaxID=3062777 RepID=UPI0026E3DFEE|nr:YqeG family HAD IIIA-type phosphatase [Caloramator sp. CAR-1]MDO6354559.1 YqeG family HAD IIIA-type phosphatase [Caloramator sp. CAR-1]